MSRAVSLGKLVIQLRSRARLMPERAAGDAVEVGAALKPRSLSDPGHALEWHLVLFNSFQHFMFELVPRLHHSVVLLLPAFPLSWLEATGPIANSMRGHSVKRLRFRPFDDMIAFAQAIASSEVSSTAMMEASDGVDPALLE